MTPEVRAKLSEHNTGKRGGGGRPVGKGWWRRKDGRIVVRVAKNVWRLRYHVVWDETHPDDPIRPGEIIHHMNHVPDDDRPENLMKITQSQHAHEHDFGHHPRARRGF